MIYITGDCHVPIDIDKLSMSKFNHDNITRDDYMIVCGDMGLIWNIEPGLKSELQWINWFERKPWTTLFIDGNHENFNRLDKYEIKTWHGGHVHEIAPHVLHLMRGQIYNIDNKTFFTMGGAVSHDKQFRYEDISWWAREMPSNAEYKTARKNLKKYHNKIDYMITHCAPSQIQHQINQNYITDKLTDFFGELYDMIDFKHWFFGHYHIDDEIGDNTTCIYKKIITLPE